MQNWQQTIISQYGNSENLTALIGYINAEIDPTANINAFYDMIWNVATAQGYGLDVWGRIVGVNRVLQVSVGASFGFTGPSGTSGEGFNVAPFFNPEDSTSNYALSDDTFRTLIYAKALANITSGSIGALNHILMTLFGHQGQCWVVDNQNMTMQYYFNFVPTPVDLSIIQTSGVLPRPPSVSLTINYP